MAQFIEIPPARVPPDTLRALLEEFASRDGTDYGLQERSLDDKVASLQRGLDSGALRLVYDSDSEFWDLVDRERATALLVEAGS